jgi:hypothetical protein
VRLLIDIASVAVSSSVAVNKIDSAFHRLLVSLASLSASNTTTTTTTAASTTTSTAAVESALAELDRLLIALQLDHCSPNHRHDDDNDNNDNDNDNSARSR